MTVSLIQLCTVDADNLGSDSSFMLFISCVHLSQLTDLFELQIQPAIKWKSDHVPCTQLGRLDKHTYKAVRKLSDRRRMFPPHCHESAEITINEDVKKPRYSSLG